MGLPMDSVTALEVEVGRFAQDMLDKLLKKRREGKKGWDGLSVYECLTLLADEVGELRSSIRKEESWQSIRDECVDVGNVAMFIAFAATRRQIRRFGPVPESGQDDK